MRLLKTLLSIYLKLFDIVTPQDRRSIYPDCVQAKAENYSHR